MIHARVMIPALLVAGPAAAADGAVMTPELIGVAGAALTGLLVLIGLRPRPEPRRVPVRSGARQKR